MTIKKKLEVMDEIRAKNAAAFARHAVCADEWKPVKGYEELYEVSANGGVRNVKRGGKMLAKCYSHGYFIVQLYKCGGKTTKGVHRLVAESFIPNPDNKPQVNHKNGIKTDNRADNLEWVTAFENHLHAEMTGLIKYKRGW